MSTRTLGSDDADVSAVEQDVVAGAVSLELSASLRKAGSHELMDSAGVEEVQPTTS